MVVVLSRLKASRCLLQRHKLYVSPARGYFSMKKSNQKSLGKDPETPGAPVRPDRKVYDLPDLGLDDAYKVFILIRFLLHPNQMRRRHLESVSAAAVRTMFTSFVSSRSLSVRGSWGTAPSVFWYGVPGGMQGPLGKGGAAKRWRVVYPIGIATRHGAKPATTHTSKRNAPAASRTGCRLPVTPRRRRRSQTTPKKLIFPVIIVLINPYLMRIQPNISP